MERKSRKIGFNNHSIKVRLLVIPIMVVTLVIMGIGLISSYNTRQSLLEEMARNGLFILEEVIGRMGDNSRSLNVIKDSIELDIRIISKAIEMLEDDLNNESLTKLAEDLQIDQLNYYRSGEILYTNIPEYVGWRPDANHPLNSFLSSSENELMEEIRIDEVSGIYFKYGTVRLSNGDCIQVGINANYIHELAEQFSTQKLVDELAANDEIVYALFIDQNLEVTAHSVEDRIGLDLSDDEGAILAVVHSTPYASEYLFGEEKFRFMTWYFQQLSTGSMWERSILDLQWKL